MSAAEHVLIAGASSAGDVVALVQEAAAGNPVATPAGMGLLIRFSDAVDVYVFHGVTYEDDAGETLSVYPTEAVVVGPADEREVVARQLFRLFAARTEWGLLRMTNLDTVHERRPQSVLA